MAGDIGTIVVTGNVQGVVQGNQNQVTMNLGGDLPHVIHDLFQEIYDPVRDNITALRLVEAEAGIERLLLKIRQVGSGSPLLASNESLTDFHQRVLIALGNIHALRSRIVDARQCLENARNLGQFSTDRSVQAAYLCLNIGDVVLLDELVKGMPYHVADVARFKCYLAWSNGDASYVLANIPPDSPDIDLLLLRAQVSIRANAGVSRNESETLIIRAWDLAGNSAFLMAAVAELSVELLQQIIQYDRPTSEMDRAQLIETIRDRLAAARDAFGPLRDSFPEGFCSAVLSSAQFHMFLGELETGTEILSSVAALHYVNRDRAVAGLLLGKEYVDAAGVSQLEAQGALAPGVYELLLAHCSILSGAEGLAESHLREGLLKNAGPIIRESLVGLCLQLLLGSKRYAEADQLLEQQQPLLTPQLSLSLRCRMICRTNGALSAAELLRSELARFPADRMLHTDFVNYCLGTVDANRNYRTSGDSEANL